MDILQSIILGAVQGFTEFLPVSSSGHLVMASTLLGVETPGVFVEVALHVGTLLSVMIVYRSRLTTVLSGALRGDREAWGYIGLLLLASIPAGFVGILFKDTIEAAFGAPWVTGLLLIITGFILWSTRRAQALTPRAPDGGLTLETPAGGRGVGDKVTLEGSAKTTISWRLALGMGLAQAAAILPGISRSGSTITAGLWGRRRGEEIAEFSFLMSVIVIAGAALLELRGLTDSIAQVGGVVLLTGFMTALIAGIIAIKSLVWLLRRQAFYIFAYYLWAVGAIFLIYTLVN